MRLSGRGIRFPSNFSLCGASIVNVRMISMLALVSFAASTLFADSPLASGVRGIATRAPDKVLIDGDLREFAGAFSTPINYFHSDEKNRPAQFFYMWDDDAFYAGLRTLDEHPANLAPDDRLWEGDGVEWYFDTRRGERFRSMKWTNDGSVHCYWVGLTGEQIKPRFCLRPGYLDAIEKVGVEVGARRTEWGVDVEFKMSWRNFPQFKPKIGEVIAVDAELCYSDGGPRVDRFFAYGSPLSVQQPASLAPVQLVDRLESEHWKSCGPVMMPMRCDTDWGQSTKPRAHALVTLPPNHADEIGRIVVRVKSLDGPVLHEAEAKTVVLHEKAGFFYARADWPVESAPPGGHFVYAVVYDKKGKELTRIAPRLGQHRNEAGATERRRVRLRSYPLKAKTKMIRDPSRVRPACAFERSR